MPEPEAFRRLPKAELHVHLDGSLRPATLLALARQGAVPLPADDESALRRAMRADRVHDLEEYLRRFAITVAVLQTPEALERVAYEMAEDAARDGVRYLEVRYAPLLSTTRGLTLDEAIAAQWRGLSRGFREFGLTGGLIVCTLRHYTPDESLATAEAALRHREGGVIGFDLAGDEARFRAAPHRAAFRLAAAGGLGITVHAGEAAGPASVREALFECGAQRLGHGTRLGEEPELLRYIRDRKIPVEIGLTSNVQTRVVDRPEAHPVRQYLDAGLIVTLCSDNWLMSDVTLSSEYDLATRALGLSRTEIETLAMNGFRSGFAPAEERQRLLQAIQPELSSWC